MAALFATPQSGQGSSLALARFAGYSGLTSEAYPLDLRQYVRWCTEQYGRPRRLRFTFNGELVGTPETDGAVWAEEAVAAYEPRVGSARGRSNVE